MKEEAHPLGLTVNANGELLRHGERYYAVGINYFSAFNRRLANAEDTSYREGFAALAEHRIPFVRFAACGFWPNDWRRYQEDKEAYFALMDDVVRAAEEHGIGLVPSLFWYYASVPDAVGEPMQAWGDPKSKTIAFMREYVEDVVTRYVDSPAIWAWELGNEYSLTADLPNASEHRPWVHPNLGTPTERSEADEMTHACVVTASREFAKAVRQFDKTRAITPGHSMPRPSAHHMRVEKSWERDTVEQFTANLIEVNPEPNDLVSVHLYPFDKEKRFGQERVAYEELLRLCLDACYGAGKAFFVGEFGASDKEEEGGRDNARRENYALLSAIERSGVQLAALWNFDLPSQEDFINVTTTNHRSYLLDALANTNRRMRLGLWREATHGVRIGAGPLRGTVYDNEANAERSGSGFNPLIHAKYPNQNLFRGDYVGLNFEHLFNGTEADKDLCMFTPRKDPCVVFSHSADSVTLRWPAEGSAWGMECEMAYEMGEACVVDMAFTAVPTQKRYPLGYAAMMWASYMNHTRGRTIHFWGMNGDEEGWVTFGEDTAEGFETGTIACHGVPDLPYEEGTKTLNILEHPTKKFLLPFYYGLVDGDGDPKTDGDTMVYIMMFDRKEPIRFALWNFITDASGAPDPTSPAWDWQYVIRNPKVGKKYGYRACMVYKPFAGADDVRKVYDFWAQRFPANE